MRRVILSVGFMIGVGMIAACGSETLPPGASSTSSPSPRAATVEEAALQHTVIDDTVDESPGKTQVTLNVVVPDNASEDDLRNLLDGLYREASGRTGFRYHRNPTVIGIYAYPSREHAESGMGQWSAMLSKTPSDDVPSISIGRSVGRPEPASVGFGLTTEERVQVFQSKVRAEDRAQAEAERRVPIGDAPTLADFQRQDDLASELQEQYTDELASELGMTRDQLDEISVEALQNNWPFPP